MSIRTTIASGDGWQLYADNPDIPKGGRVFLEVTGIDFEVTTPKEGRRSAKIWTWASTAFGTVTLALPWEMATAMGLLPREEG